MGHILKILNDWKFQRQCVLRGCRSFSTWPWKQDFTTHPPPHPNDISLSGRALQPNTASSHSLLLMCFKSTDSDTCGYWQRWDFSHHYKTSHQSCEKKAQEKRIFTAVLRAIGSVKLGTRGTWTPVPSCPKCSLPAPPLVNLIPRRNEEDQLHPYFCGKEFELHKCTGRYQHEHKRFNSRKCRCNLILLHTGLVSGWHAWKAMGQLNIA